MALQRELTIRIADEDDAEPWDEFVRSHSISNNAHRFGWRSVVSESFGWPCFYLIARTDKICGVLPLVWQKSALFGSFLTSVPFLNAGGILASDPDTEAALAREAIILAQGHDVPYVELRFRTGGELGPEWKEKNTKVTLVKELAADPDAMLAAMDKKLRADVKKSLKSGFTVEFGGSELLHHFYAVFAENMRDLGTPVYSKSFFASILHHFPGEVMLCRVMQGTEPVATSFLIASGQRLEAMWSASRMKFRPLKPNMFMYWQIMCHAGARGFTEFDFGRSSLNSPTHRFKLQWHTRELPLPWRYWTSDGSTRMELNPENPKYRLPILVWKKLPLAIANLLGPKIVRNLP